MLHSFQTDSSQTLQQQFDNISGCSLGTGKGPDPVWGFGVSSMVVGQSPPCLLVHWFKSGCSVEVSIRNDNNMGKQVEVRWRKYFPLSKPDCSCTQVVFLPVYISFCGIQIILFIHFTQRVHSKVFFKLYSYSV